MLDILSFWTFSDVFEEGGPVHAPFPSIFGLLAAGGIKKPSYYAFSLFHKLGTTRLAAPAENVLVTRRENGSVVIAVWNLSPPDQPGKPRTFLLDFSGLPGSGDALLSRIDSTHANTLAAYQHMGSPRYPTPSQIQQLNDETALPAPEPVKITVGRLPLQVPVNGLALIELQP